MRVTDEARRKGPNRKAERSRNEAAGERRDEGEYKGEQQNSVAVHRVLSGR